MAAAQARGGDLRRGRRRRPGARRDLEALPLVGRRGAQPRRLSRKHHFHASPGSMLRMTGWPTALKCAARVLADRRVAAPHVAAGQAEAQVHPRRAVAQALLAAARACAAPARAGRRAGARSRRRGSPPTRSSPSASGSASSTGSSSDSSRSTAVIAARSTCRRRSRRRGRGRSCPARRRASAAAAAGRWPPAARPRPGCGRGAPRRRSRAASARSRSWSTTCSGSSRRAHLLQPCQPRARGLADQRGGLQGVLGGAGHRQPQARHQPRERGPLDQERPRDDHERGELQHLALGRLLGQQEGRGQRDDAAHAGPRHDRARSTSSTTGARIRGRAVLVGSRRRPSRRPPARGWWRAGPRRRSARCGRRRGRSRRRPRGSAGSGGRSAGRRRSRA